MVCVAVLIGCASLDRLLPRAEGPTRYEGSKSKHEPMFARGSDLLLGHPRRGRKGRPGELCAGSEGGGRDSTSAL